MQHGRSPEIGVVGLIAEKLPAVGVMDMLRFHKGPSVLQTVWQRSG